jgi:hypothetical protein
MEEALKYFENLGRFFKLKNSSIHSQYGSKYTHQFNTFQMSPLRCAKYEL